MGSISNFPSLGLLQGSLFQAVGALSSEASQLALQDVRQISGFNTLFDLNGLLSQDSLSRMVVHPALFDEVSKAASIFGDLPALKETFALPTLEERLEVCAQVLDLRHGVQIFAAASEQPGKGEAKRFVESALQAAGNSKSTSRVLKDELNWPHQLTFQSVGTFAVSIRKVFDAREDHLNPKQRYQLMLLASYMNAAAAEVCRFDPAEIRSPAQAVKMAALMEVLYGCGFGNERLSAEEADRLLSEVKAADEALSLTGYAGLTGAALTLSQHLAALNLP